MKSQQLILALILLCLRLLLTGCTMRPVTKTAPLIPGRRRSDRKICLPYLQPCAIAPQETLITTHN
ncbi:hypothetical protein PMG71_08495 [Roseofilum sp. BLCC_M154]|uniref:Uncharacterized protein n=1 Tax=Roseofilum acuticapitatum BLCC-M154 TaxID=3022444 RepID=A0ABT7ATS1_9CYAN|nr:hypothetical protein [Roseofilum acuticapitatum]MDJ1169463.1 hypothetical protein [Roseofilum acuticapitatum BLCC-M154]